MHHEYQLAFLAVACGWKEPDTTICLRLHGRKPRILIKGILHLNLCDVLITISIILSTLYHHTVHAHSNP